MADLSLTSSVTAAARGGVDEKTGEVLTSRQVVERVSWLAAITTGLSRELIENAWNAGDLATLAAGVGPDGRALPTCGYMALRRPGWWGLPVSGSTVMSLPAPFGAVLGVPPATMSG